MAQLLRNVRVLLPVAGVSELSRILRNRACWGLSVSQTHTRASTMADGGDNFSAGIRKLAKKCNSFFNEGSSRKSCVGFFIEGTQVGLVLPNVAEKFKQFPDVFDVVPEGTSTGRPVGVHLSQNLKTPEERTVAVNTVMETFRDKNEFPQKIRGWHDEKYNIATSFSSEPLMQVERAAAPLLGVITYGTHINGFTYNDCGEMMMWIATRAKDKSTYPGLYDNMCAGGLGNGLEVLECAWKECQEEASVEDEVLEDLKSVGMISYCIEDERGVMPEGEFVFDLEVPQDFQPVNDDGEVAQFELMSISKVKELIAQDQFKPNSAFVILDFLIRHGFITPDTEPDYCFMVEQTHTPVQNMFSSSS